MEHQPAPDSLVSHLGPGPALIFALNPGEELAGCAGAVFAHRAKDEQVTVILLSDGCPDAPETAAPVLTPALARIRAAAVQSAYPHPLCWHLSRRDFSDGEALIARLMKAIRESGACLVYAPAADEIHPLRQLAAMAAQEAVYRTGGRLWLAQYPVERAFVANRLLDIRPYRHAKAAILHQFVTGETAHGQPAHAESAMGEPFRLRPANELQAENQPELYAARCAAAASQVQLGEACAQLQELDRQLADLRATIANLRAENSALRQSLSWRLTRPLRAVGRLAQLVTGTVPPPAEIEPPAAAVLSEYERWIDTYEQLEPIQLDALRADIASWQQPPRLSILMPVYDTPEPWLRRAIDSVLAQSYPHWELCIADDASPSAHVQTLLQDYGRRDRRIKLVNRPHNGHIAAASNSALALADGDFICLLDHDDKLAPHALYLMACAIRAYPDKDLFYSDEDKIDAKGRRFEPYFKPDWNPDLFLSYNFFNHFGAFRTSLVRELGGFRVGYEGAEDYDLVLRAIARVGHDKIHHIPHVLYHWGVIPGSAAANHAEKPYALGAAIRAVSEHLAGQHIDAEVTESSPGSGTLRVRYVLPDPPPRVSIIIPTRDGYTLLRKCLDSIYARTTYPNFEVLIIDNGSEDPLVLDYLQTQQASRGVRVLRDDRPFNYPALNNAAAQQAEGELLCLMNNDIEVISPDWLEEMVSEALRTDIGMVGCRLWYPDDTLQHAGVILGIGGVAGHAHHRLNRTQRGYFSRAQLVQNYSAVTSACAVLRASVFWEVGGFNERHLAVAFNDIDLCVRIRNAGYRNLWTPYAELYHCESASRGYEDTPEKKARFQREKAFMIQCHGDTLLNDPAYNPNLALERQDYTLAYPPRIGVLAIDARTTKKNEMPRLIRHASGAPLMGLAMDALASKENFVESAYLAANPDVAAAVKRGDLKSGRQHFEVCGYKEGRRQHISGGAVFAAVKKKKLDRIQPLLRKDMPYVFDKGCPDFLSPELRDRFAIIDSDAVSSNGYDTYGMDLIEKHRDGLILDCGAGRRSVYFENVVNFEIAAYDTTDVRGVGEVLPFLDASFDVVFSLSVLGHVKDPFVCAREIVRVLKPGGDLMCAVPLLQPVHSYPHHYYNMTAQGLKNLFPKDIELDRHEVYSSVLPIWSLTWIVRSWAEGLTGRAKQEFLNLRISGLLDSGDKYLDRSFVKELPQEKNFELASATVLFGHKTVSLLSETETGR